MYYIYIKYYTNALSVIALYRICHDMAHWLSFQHHQNKKAIVRTDQYIASFLFSNRISLNVA